MRWDRLEGGRGGREGCDMVVSASVFVSSSASMRACAAALSEDVGSGSM